MKTKKEIIDETVEFYKNNPRSVVYDEFGDHKCKYLGPKGERCAFSRCCIESFKDFQEGKNVLAQLGKCIQILKEEYRIDDIHFWVNIQMIHDAEPYWNKRNLTKRGEHFVSLLHKKYDEH